MAELSDTERERLLNQFSTTHGDEGKKLVEQAKATEQGRMGPVGADTSARRGAVSGALMGFQPQVAGALSAVNPFSDETYSQSRDKAAQLNDQAFNANKLAYGAGYAGGTAATLPLGGALLKGAQAVGKGLSMMPKLGAVGEGLAEGAGSLNTFLKSNSIIRPDSKFLSTPPATSIGQGIGSIVGNQTNEVPPGVNARPLVDPNGKENNIQVPISSNETPSRFEQLRQYLSQIEDPQEKMKVAMALNASGQGLSENNT